MSKATPLPAVAPTAQALVPVVPLRDVQFEGVVQLFTSNMPESSFVDFSDGGGHMVFACCWIDGKRGVSARVVFPSNGPGVFRLSLPFRDDDPDKLKLQVSMRMQDEGSHNRRTVPLCTSCACMRAMLGGNLDEFRVLDPNITGDYAVVSMRIVNYAEFVGQPLRLRVSSLERIPELNASFRSVGAAIEENNKKNNTVFPRDAVTMKDGLSRWFGPPASLLLLRHLVLLSLSLFPSPSLSLPDRAPVAVGSLLAV